MVDTKRQTELNQALELLHFAFRAVVARPDKILAGRGLGRVHHRILYFIGRHPDCSVHDLLQKLNISRQALNEPLRELQSHNLVQYSLSAKDRRIKQLRLTSQGVKLEDLLSGDQRARFSATFKRVGRSKENNWREIMALLANESGIPD